MPMPSSPRFASCWLGRTAAPDAVVGEVMDLDSYNEYCGSLAATTHVVQWGDAHVWKVGGKVFAIAGWSDSDEVVAVTFKTSPDEYDFLIEMEGVRPAPYLASRGFTWVQHYGMPGLDDDDLREQIAESHRLVGLGLSKKKQRELGLLDGASAKDS
jgi:predicted DNA-binding protein (MmcQ/YjbR family)